MAWPTGTSLVAIDRTRAMLGAVFPDEAGPALVGDWRALPVRDRAFDWIVGDGCATLLEAYAAGGAAVAARELGAAMDLAAAVNAAWAAVASGGTAGAR